MISAILQSMRPKQWTKNLFVFAGLLFSLDRAHPAEHYARVVAAFVLFCMLSGSVYLLNDVCDVERDRMHPRKRYRPIASGRLSTRTASLAAVFLAAAALAGAFALGLGFGATALGYAVLLVAYSFLLKGVVLLDVMTIATGFVLRAVAGAAVIHVAISPWLLTCTILIALFLGLAKRRQEMVGLQDQASNHRSSLEHYTVPFLDQLIGITASATIIAYTLYTFFSATGSKHPYMMATIPFVIYGIFRYLLLIHKNEGADSPEILLLKDKPLLLDVFLWALACGTIILRG